MRYAVSRALAAIVMVPALSTAQSSAPSQVPPATMALATTYAEGVTGCKYDDWLKRLA